MTHHHHPAAHERRPDNESGVRREETGCSGYGQAQRHSHAHDGHGDHAGHGHAHAHAPNNKAGLVTALAITSGIMLLEFVGGLVTNSLALLSDAGHMLSDAAALALSLIAMGLAAKPPSPGKSYGLHRFEILAALLNGATLFVMAGFIVREAVERLADPPQVESGAMMIVAAVGLLANLASAWILMRKGDVKGNLNVRSAYLHVLGDALGSVGAIGAGLLMYLFGWAIADPIISIAVALLILRSAWGVLRSAVHVLMEGTPPSVSPERVRDALLQIAGVTEVHDLHVWTITSGKDSLTCHLLIERDGDDQAILREAIARVERLFAIRHSTIQIEKSRRLHERPTC